MNHVGSVAALCRKLATRSRHSKLQILLIVLLVCLPSTVSIWQATTEYTETERGTQLMGNADYIIRSSRTTESVDAVNKATQEIKSYIQHGHLVPRIFVESKLKTATGLHHLNASAFPLDSPTVAGMYHVRFDPKPTKTQPSVLLPTATLKRLGLDHAHTTAPQQLELFGESWQVGGVYTQPANPGAEELLINADSLEILPDGVTVTGAAWYLEGDADFDAITSHGYDIMSRSDAISNSTFPSVVETFVPWVVAVLCTMVYAMLVLGFNREDRIQWSVLSKLGLGPMQVRSVAALTLLLRLFIAGATGFLFSLGFGWCLTRLTQHMTGMEYGELTVDWPVEFTVFFLYVLVSLLPAALINFKKKQIRSKQTTIWNTASWWPKLTVREFLNAPDRSVVGLASVCALVLAALAATTVLQALTNRLELLEKHPSFAPGWARVEMGTQNLTHAQIDSLSKQLNASISTLAWASLPGQEGENNTLAIDTDAFRCVQKAYLKSIETKVFDTKTCALQANDMRSSPTIAIMDSKNAQVYLDRDFTSEERTDYSKKIFCVDMRCPKQVTITSLDPNLKVGSVPTRNIANITTRGLGFPAVLISPKLANKHGIEQNGSPPLTDGTIFRSYSQDKSVVIHSDSNEPFSSLGARADIALRNLGVSSQVPQAGEEVEKSAANLLLLLILGVGFLLTVLVGCVVSIWNARRSHTLKLLQILGVSKSALELRTRCTNTVILLAPTTVGGLAGTLLGWAFLRSQQMGSLFSIPTAAALFPLLICTVALLLPTNIGAGKS